MSFHLKALSGRGGGAEMGVRSRRTDLDSRERVTRALRFEKPDRAPRDLWTLPGIAMFRQDELEEMRQRFPRDLAHPAARYGRGTRESGTRHVVGTSTDEWGCVWHVAEPGVAGEVKGAPLAEWSALDTLRPPYEILEQADLSQVNRSCAETDRFVLAGTTVRPFERMQFLRGSQALHAAQPTRLRLLTGAIA